MKPYVVVKASKAGIIGHYFFIVLAFLFYFHLLPSYNDLTRAFIDSPFCYWQWHTVAEGKVINRSKQDMYFRYDFEFHYHGSKYSSFSYSRIASVSIGEKVIIQMYNKNIDLVRINQMHMNTSWNNVVTQFFVIVFFYLGTVWFSYHRYRWSDVVTYKVYPRKARHQTPKPDKNGCQFSSVETFWATFFGSGIPHGQ